MTLLSLPPYPLDSNPGDFVWVDWYQQLQSFVQSISSVSWNALNFSGSNLTDIQTRHHDDLQQIQGGSSPSSYYHLTQTQWQTITNTTSVTASNSATATSVTASTSVTPVNDSIVFCFASGTAANSITSATFSVSGGTLVTNQNDHSGDLAIFRSVITINAGTTCTINATVSQGTSGTIQTSFTGFVMLAT